MDRQQIGLKLALNALDRELALGSFDERLILQKTIYLVQAAGVDLGYTFTWYLRGPYSPGLTQDAFALRAESGTGTAELADWKFDPKSAERMGRLRELLVADSDIAPARRLELLASVHFLLRTRQASSSDLAGLRDVLARNDKHFTETEIRTAIKELETHGIPTTRAR